MDSVEYAALANTVGANAPSGSALYTAWRSGGAWAILVRAVFAQLTMAGVMLLLYVLTTAINRRQLQAHLSHLLCPDTTPNQASLFVTDCWGDTPIDMRREPDGWVVFTLFVASVASTVEAVGSVAAAYRVHATDTWCRDVGVVDIWDSPWDEVCTNIIPLMDISAADFRASITRRSNTFVKLYGSALGTTAQIPRTLHAGISVALLLHRFTPLAPWACFTLVGVGSLALLPALLIGTLCQYVFRNGAALRNGSSGVGALLTRRSFSRRAKWSMRKEDEMEHMFEERVEAATEIAVRVLSAIPVPHWVFALANSVMVLSGAFTVTVLLLTVVVDDQVVAANLGGDRSTAFFVAVAGAVIALAAPCVVRPVPIDLSQHMVQLRGFAPELLVGAATLEDQCGAVSSAMQFWVEEFAWELVGLVVTPFKLMALPAEHIVAL